MKTLMFCALVALAAIGTARAGEPSSLRLDLEHAQALTVDAHGVSVEQVLAELGERLNFTVDFSPQANRSAAVNGKFQGDLSELLAEILRGTNFVAQYGAQGVTHIVIMAPNTGTASSGTATASAGAAPTGAPAKVIENKPVASSTPANPSTPSATQNTTPLPTDNGAPPSMVSKLLENQASVLTPRDQSAAAATPAPAGGQSMAVMTRAAQANVQALVAALNSACIGDSCSH